MAAFSRSWKAARSEEIYALQVLAFRLDRPIGVAVCWVLQPWNSLGVFLDVSCERSEMAQEHALALEGCLGSFDDANGSAYCLAKWTCCMFFELHIMAFLGVQADGETKMCNKKHSLMLLVPKATCAVCLCDYVEGEVLRRCIRETMGGIL